MKEYFSLNGLWRFCADPDKVGLDQQWKTQENQPYLDNKTRIFVPSCWNRKPWKKYADYKGVAWFWRSFRVPPHFNGKEIYLEITRIAHKAIIFIDSEEIGSFEGGFIPFQLKITKFADNQDHFLAILIDGSEEARRYSLIPDTQEYFGIFGDVNLIAEEFLVMEEFSHTTKIHFDDAGEKVKYAEIEFSIYLINNGDKDYAGNIKIVLSRDFVPIVETEREIELLKKNSRLAKIIINVEKADLYLWTPETPEIYNFSIIVGNEGGNIIGFNEILGIREVSIKNDEIILNHKPYDVVGFDFEIEEPTFGYSIPNTLIIDKLVKLKEANINTLRPNQGTFSPLIVEMASRLGFIVIGDLPVVNLSLGEKNTFFKKYVDSITYQPSLVCWSVSRRFTDQYESDPNMQKTILEMQKIFHSRLDPSRLFVPTGNIKAKSWIINTLDGLKDILK
jgi:beta-glucuronidase